MDKNLKPQYVGNGFALHNHSKARGLPSTDIQVLHDSFKRWWSCERICKGKIPNLIMFGWINN